ncbi:hypothetical protein J8M21_23455 [Pseudoalteromonas luteoviolacea]|uniref:hypothetical protein n=1 Tax=Pseudoalteromonas luteoviolacea TaxID=43657 RepID=UPI001B39F81E|nr:hypothetical protein [Pseudoalteromonas luteoviolacea]MBQ4880162.1 hypothetical protein [Pseudoalteromonas luteoviolacea]MBQ4909223.1 hypothetical protein [Pseudoalteromonas luteoviolacea]
MKKLLSLIFALSPLAVSANSSYEGYIESSRYYGPITICEYYWTGEYRGGGGGDDPYPHSAIRPVDSTVEYEDPDVHIFKVKGHSYKCLEPIYMGPYNRVFKLFAARRTTGYL